MSPTCGKNNAGFMISDNRYRFFVVVIVIACIRMSEPEVDVAIFTHISGTRSVLFRQLPTDSTFVSKKKGV